MYAWRCSGSWTVREHSDGPVEAFVVLPAGEQSQRQQQASGVMFEALIEAAQLAHPDAQAVTVEIHEVALAGRALHHRPSLYAS